MQPHGEPSRALLRLANAQAHVLTREQVLGLEMSRHTLRRLVDQERWQRLAPGVFVTHNGPVEWDTLAWAGVLLGGPGARLGGTAAGYGHQLLEDAPSPVEVLVPHASPTRSRSFWTFVKNVQAHGTPGARDRRRGSWCPTPCSTSARARARACSRTSSHVRCRST